MSARPVARALTLGTGFGGAAMVLLQARIDGGRSHDDTISVDALAAMTVEGFRWAAITLAVVGALSALAAAAAEARASRATVRHRTRRAAFAARPLLRLLLGPGCALLLSPAATAWAGPTAGTVRPPPVLVPIDAAPTAGLDPASATVPPAAVAEQAPTDSPELSGDQSSETRLVRPGEHFWSIARDLVAADLGRPPTAAEIMPRWLGLIESNRSRLVDPGNPDLLIPGQELDISHRSVK